MEKRLVEGEEKDIHLDGSSRGRNRLSDVTSTLGDDSSRGRNTLSDVAPIKMRNLIHVSGLPYLFKNDEDCPYLSLTQLYLYLFLCIICLLCIYLLTVFL